VGTYNALADPRRIYGGEGREKKKQKEGRGEEERTERDRDGKMGEGKENGKQGVGVFSHL